MKKRGLLGLLLACMVMLGASMTVFAADKVIDCNDKDMYTKCVDKLVVSGGETFQIIQKDNYAGINLIRGVTAKEISNTGTTYSYKVDDDKTKKYVFKDAGWSITNNVYVYEFWFEEYTETEKPAEPQPASQMVEEPGEQLGGGLKSTNISSNG